MFLGLEKNVQYNDHELPTQLSPDQYFKLEWALSKDRQELAHTGRVKVKVVYLHKFKSPESYNTILIQQ